MESLVVEVVFDVDGGSVKLVLGLRSSDIVLLVVSDSGGSSFTTFSTVTFWTVGRLSFRFLDLLLVD